LVGLLSRWRHGRRATGETYSPAPLYARPANTRRLAIIGQSAAPTGVRRSASRRAGARPSPHVLRDAQAITPPATGESAETGPVDGTARGWSSVLRDRVRRDARCSRVACRDLVWRVGVGRSGLVVEQSRERRVGMVLGAVSTPRQAIPFLVSAQLRHEACGAVRRR
jgi:hypothetical protein